MNSQRAFWLSGALTLGVLAVLGTAINFRQTEPAAPASVSQQTEAVQQSAPAYREREEDEEHERREHEHGEHRRHSERE